MRALFFLLALVLSACSSQKPHADEAEIKQFLTRYFSTWSAQDMAGYEGCFHPQARVSYVDQSGNASSQGLTDFIHGQKMGHQAAAKPMIEVPLEMRISGDRRISQAAVYWKLTKAEGEELGWDYFTLIKTAAGWRILALAFYAE